MISDFVTFYYQSWMEFVKFILGFLVSYHYVLSQFFIQA